MSQAKLWTPATLGRLTYPGWQYPRHIQKLDAFVMELLSNPRVSRAIVQIPVRHGKSIYCSHLLPCWHMLTKPDKNVWINTYGSSFAEEFGIRNLDLMREHGPNLTGFQLHKDFARRAHFRAAPPHTGECRGLGIYGGLAGKGAHLIICDDLIKEFAEVVTEEARDRIWHRFHNEVLNRLEPGGKILVVMSRRHPDDLSGRLLASNSELPSKDQWHELTFPALSDDGIALWPERYPAEQLLSIKRTLELANTPWVWYGLYQQDAASCSELTEWPASFWKDIFYKELPNFSPRLRLQSLDPSVGKEAKPGDFAGLLAGLVDPEGTLWVDARIVRMPLTSLEDYSVALCREHNPHAFAIETNGFQEAVAVNISRKYPSAPIMAYVNTEKKEVRIRILLTALLTGGRVKIKDTVQGRMMVQQLRDFPLAKHDDGPDSLALMVQLWRDLLHGQGVQTGIGMP